MVLPIVAYGDPVLKKPGKDIDKEYPNLLKLIADMFETMYHAKGVGLAAPQVGLAIRLFVVDASGFAEGEDGEKFRHLKDFKKVFINPKIVDESGEEWDFEEGCLSIPGIREPVDRLPKVRLQYFDENFVFHDDKFDGIPARIIQHEYDHIEGVLFIDHLNPLKRRLLKRKLNDISVGNVEVAYKMKFPGRRK